MRHKQKKSNVESKKLKVLGFATLLIFAFSLSSVRAQTSVNATGGNAYGGGGSASYSVGQIFYTTNIGTNGSVTQGVQQAFEIYVVTAIEDSKSINLSVWAYPNPITDYLKLEVYASTKLSIQSMTYQLYDMQGKLLQSEKITSNQTKIEMRNLVPASYFLKVVQGNKEVKTFKIIKTQ